jgi:hypothetical protein
MRLQSNAFLRRHWLAASAALFAAVAMVSAGPALLASSSFTLPSVEAAPSNETSRLLSSNEARGLLIAAGLTPSILAASGIQAEQASAMIAAAHQYALEHQSELDGADRAVGEARNRASEHQRQSQPGSQVQPAAEQGAVIQAQLAAAVATRSSVRTALRQAACADLSDASRLQIANMLANSGREGVATKFLAVQRTEPEWLALREDLTHVAQATEQGVTPDAQVLARVLEAESDPAVIAAAQNLQAGLASIEQAFEPTGSPR